MPEDLGNEGIAEGVVTIGRHTFTKERQPEAMSKLSYHQPKQPPSKIMFRVIRNRLKAKAEELLAEQAGFRPGRSTLE